MLDQSREIFPNIETTFEGGTKRSCRKPLYHLVPLELIQAVAETRAAGDQKYAPGNWNKGSKEFFVDCLGHAIEHLMLCAWDEDEDIFTHLGHAACNIGFILWALKRNKVTRLDLQRAAVIAQDEKREALERLQKEQQAQIQAANLQSQMLSRTLRTGANRPRPTDPMALPYPSRVWIGQRVGRQRQADK